MEKEPKEFGSSKTTKVWSFVIVKIILDKMINKSKEKFGVK
jgi:hypothetical protein